MRLANFLTAIISLFTPVAPAGCGPEVAAVSMVQRYHGAIVDADGNAGVPVRKPSMSSFPAAIWRTSI